MKPGLVPGFFVLEIASRYYFRMAGQQSFKPVFLFTDFGFQGPYVGQLHAAIHAVDPTIKAIDLMHDAPMRRPDLSAFLLPAVSTQISTPSVVLAVVDPGVGGDRKALLVETSTHIFVGPDNGLMARLSDVARVSTITWRPGALSSSFHGRDLFAPVAARLACGLPVETAPASVERLVRELPSFDAARVIYIDGYGNLMTSLGPRDWPEGRQLSLGKQVIVQAGTFCQVPDGNLLWYFNSQNLLEIACNGGSAAERLSLALGDTLLLD